MPAAWYLPDGKILGLMECQRKFILDHTKQVAFRDGSDIGAGSAQKRNGGIMMMLHFLQSLPKGKIIIDILYIYSLLGVRKNKMFMLCRFTPYYYIHLRPDANSIIYYSDKKVEQTGGKFY